MSSNSQSSATDIEREIQFGKLSSWWPTVLRTVDLNNGLTSCLSRALVSNHVILETALGTRSPNPVQEIIAFPAQPARAESVMKSCQLDASIISTRLLIGRHVAGADQWQRRRCQRRRGLTSDGLITRTDTRAAQSPGLSDTEKTS